MERLNFQAIEKKWQKKFSSSKYFIRICLIDAYFTILSIRFLSISILSMSEISKLFVCFNISLNNNLFSLLNNFTFSIKLKLSLINEVFFSKIYKNENSLISIAFNDFVSL